VDDRQLHRGLRVPPFWRVLDPLELGIPGSCLVIDREVLVELTRIRSQEQVLVTVADVEYRLELFADAVVLRFGIVKIDERLVVLQQMQPRVGEILPLDAARDTSRQHVEDDAIERVIQIGITHFVCMQQIQLALSCEQLGSSKNRINHSVYPLSRFVVHPTGDQSSY